MAERATSQPQLSCHLISSSFEGNFQSYFHFRRHQRCLHLSSSPLPCPSVPSRERRPSCFDVARPSYTLQICPVCPQLAEKMPVELGLVRSHGWSIHTWNKCPGVGNIGLNMKEKRKKKTKKNSQKNCCFNISGVAGAILQTPLQSLILCENIFRTPSLQNRKS